MLKLGILGMESNILDVLYFNLQDLLMLYIEDERLLDIMINSPIWFGNSYEGKEMNGRGIEKFTLLGVFLKPSVFTANKMKAIVELFVYSNRIDTF